MSPSSTLQQNRLNHNQKNMGGIKTRRATAKADHHDEVTSPSAQLQPFHQQILKREHADHEVFDTRSFPFDELIPNWKGELFDPHFMNAATGQTFTNKHHVKGEGVKKRADFERLEFGFCLEWIDRNLDGVVIRDRCYNQFTVKSQGCGNHPKAMYKDGPNAVYYRLLRGEVCNWGILKDSEAPIADDTRSTWTYVDWSKHARALARDEADVAASQSREDYEDIITTRMTQFEKWWRLEEKKDRQQGGAQATAARGYSLMGTRTLPPAFMSRRISELPLATDDPLPGFSRLTLREPALTSQPVANNRIRFGKDTTEGRPDLDAKRGLSQQAKSRKSQAGKNAALESGKENFFSKFGKNRKPRHGDKDAGDNGN